MFVPESETDCERLDFLAGIRPSEGINGEGG